jgi:hypothetical protein
MSKGGSGSSMTQAGGQSSFGGQMPMQQQGYQSPFGNQNYRSQPSQPAFNNYSYQQPGQFGGQIMNQSMRSPSSKGGYSAPVMQQPMRSPGGKGGYQPPMRQQMPSPGGKGRSYQPQQIPSGYGQSTFNPGQFGGYGQPSNMFSFSSPHYQPYVPPVYEPPPPPPPPYRGDDPRGSGVASSPPSTGSKGGTQRPTEGSGNFGYQDYFSSDAGQEVVKNIRNIIGIPDFSKIDERLSSIESRPAPVAPTIDYDTITDRVRQGINIPQIDYDAITNRVKQGINIPQIDTSGIMSAINSNREAISGIKLPDFSGIESRLGQIENRPLPTIDYDTITDRVRQGINIPFREERVFTPPPLGNNPPPPPDYGFTPPKPEPISAPPPSFSGINQDFNADFITGMPKPFMPEVIHSAPVSFGSEYSKAPAQLAVGPPITRGNNRPVNPLRSEFTPPTQPPAPVNNQTLTPVMPKPTPPSMEAPVFPSVGGIGGGFIPTGPEPRFNPLPIGETPRPIFSDMSAEQKEQEEKYRAAQAKKPRYFDNVTGKPVTQAEYDALGGNKQSIGGPQTLMQGEQNQYGTAKDELMERNIKTMGPESLNTSLFDMLRKSSGGIDSLMGPSGLPGRSESFTPPKNPLDILLAERGFQIPERNLGGSQDHVQFGVDPVTGLMRFGGSSDTEYYRKLDEIYAQNPEALEIVKQYHADQLKKAREGAQGGIFDLQKPMEQITYSPKQPVPQRDMNMGPGSFGIPLGRLR